MIRAAVQNPCPAHRSYEADNCPVCGTAAVIRTATCNACGLPSTEEFCTRPECLTYGSGACAPGPSIRNI